MQKKRIIKAPEVRRAEILQFAGDLFQIKGYESTSVNEIVEAAGIAKGTFYHYFKSKEGVLSALSDQLIAEMSKHSQMIADEPNLDAITKLCNIIRAQRTIQQQKLDIVANLHRPENYALHEYNNIQWVRIIGPILASVVEQGKQEGVFDVDDALSTVQFILAGSLKLIGEHTFNWTENELEQRTLAMLILTERALGAKKNSFAPRLAQCL